MVKLLVKLLRLLPRALLSPLLWTKDDGRKCQHSQLFLLNKLEANFLALFSLESLGLWMQDPQGNFLIERDAHVPQWRGFCPLLKSDSQPWVVR